MGKILRTGADGKLKSAEMQIIVTRADGTVEDLGTQAYWHKNPLKRLLYRITGRTQ